MKRKRHKKDKHYLQVAAERIEHSLPDNQGFLLLTVPFKQEDPEQNRVAYVSNVERKEAIALMKEFLIRCGEEEEWMKHLD
jgi:hypothetical protein